MARNDSGMVQNGLLARFRGLSLSLSLTHCPLFSLFAYRSLALIVQLAEQSCSHNLVRERAALRRTEKSQQLKSELDAETILGWGYRRLTG